MQPLDSVIAPEPPADFLSAEPVTAPAPPPPTTRIPHFGHAALFVILFILSQLACGAVGILAFHRHDVLNALRDQKFGLLAQIAAYAVTLAGAWFIFPLLWGRSFLNGLHWNVNACKPRLIGFGVVVSVVSAATSTLLPHPKDTPLEQLFRNHGLIWIIAIFGTLVAPLFEEIVFRGFLLPAFAIAVDYARLPQTGSPADAVYTPQRVVVVRGLFTACAHRFFLVDECALCAAACSTIGTQLACRGTAVCGLTGPLRGAHSNAIACG